LRFLRILFSGRAKFVLRSRFWNAKIGFGLVQPLNWVWIVVVERQNNGKMNGNELLTAGPLEIPPKSL
jgi:hypothetical protein